jgi:peptidoglycan-associated lipoprotein
MRTAPTFRPLAHRRRLPMASAAAGLLMASLAACSTMPQSADATKSVATGQIPSPPLYGVAVADSLRTAAGDRVLFDYDSAIVREKDLPMLRAAAAWLKQHPASRITIEGHADERGTREYNLALGARRAEALDRVLLGFDVPKSQIAGTVSYGKERPVVVGSSEESWAQNRRAMMAVE